MSKEGAGVSSWKDGGRDVGLGVEHLVHRARIAAFLQELPEHGVQTQLTRAHHCSARALAGDWHTTIKLRPPDSQSQAIRGMSDNSHRSHGFQMFPIRFTQNVAGLSGL